MFRADARFRLNPACPACGFAFERGNDEGFFLGSMSLNYGVTLVGFLLPVALLAYHGVMPIRVRRSWRGWGRGGCRRCCTGHRGAGG